MAKKEKNRGGDDVLVRVSPSRLEIVSRGHALANDPASWRPVAISFARNEHQGAPGWSGDLPSDTGESRMRTTIGEPRAGSLHPWA